MLKNVVNLGALPSCASDLEIAFQIIDATTPAKEPFGFGRALLSGNEKSSANPFSSVILLRAGTLTLKSTDGTTISLEKGEAANLPAGELVWSADNADCVILVLRQDNPELKLSKLNLDQPMSPGGAPNPALLTTPAPQTTRYEFFEQDKISWGVWATSPYARHPLQYTFAEVMMLSKGEVTLANDEDSATFVTGDIFLVQPGACVSWQNTVDLEKFWLIRSGD